MADVSTLQGKADRFEYLKQTDPAAARAFLESLTEEEIAGIKTIRQGKAPALVTKEAPRLSKGQMQEVLDYAQNLKNLAARQNKAIADIPEYAEAFRSIVGGLSPADMEIFRAEFTKSAAEEMHPSVPEEGILARFQTEAMTTPDSKLATARKYFPEERGWIVRKTEDDDIELRREGEPYYKKLDPPFFDAIVKGDYNEIGRDLLEASPELLTEAMLASTGGGIGTAVGLRLGGKVARAIRPASKFLTKSDLKFIPRYSGITGHALGSGAGTAAGEALRQTAGMAGGAVQEYSPSDIVAAGGAGTIGGLLTGVQELPGTGKLGWLGQSPEAVEKDLAYNFGKRKGEVSTTFNLRDVQPLRKAGYNIMTGVRSLMSEGKLSEDFLESAQQGMRRYMRTQAAGAATGRSGSLQEIKGIINKITGAVVNKKAQLGNELNTLYGQVTDPISLAKVQGKIDQAMEFYANKSNMDNYGLGDVDLKFRRHLKDMEDKMFTRYYELKKGDLSKEDIALQKSLGIKHPKVWTKKTTDIPLTEALKLKQDMQDYISVINKKAAKDGWTPSMRERHDRYALFADTLKESIEDAVNAADAAVVEVTGKRINRPLSVVNAEYSDLLQRESNLRRAGLYNIDLRPGAKKGHRDISDLSYDELEALGDAPTPEAIDLMRLNKGINAVAGISKGAQGRMGALEEVQQLKKITGDPGLTDIEDRIKSVGISTQFGDLPSRPQSVKIGGSYAGLKTQGNAGPLSTMAEAWGIKKFLSPKAQQKAMVKPYLPMYPELMDKPAPVWRPISAYPANWKELLERSAWTELVGDPLMDEQNRKELQQGSLETLKSYIGGQQ